MTPDEENEYVENELLGKYEEISIEWNINFS